MVLKSSVPQSLYPDKGRIGWMPNHKEAFFYLTENHFIKPEQKKVILESSNPYSDLKRYVNQNLKDSDVLTSDFTITTDNMIALVWAVKNVKEYHDYYKVGRQMADVKQTRRLSGKEPQVPYEELIKYREGFLRLMIEGSISFKALCQLDSQKREILLQNSSQVVQLIAKTHIRFSILCDFTLEVIKALMLDSQDIISFIVNDNIPCDTVVRFYKWLHTKNYEALFSCRSNILKLIAQANIDDQDLFRLNADAIRILANHYVAMVNLIKEGKLSFENLCQLMIHNVLTFEALNYLLQFHSVFIQKLNESKRQYPFIDQKLITEEQRAVTFLLSKEWLEDSRRYYDLSPIKIPQISCLRNFSDILDALASSSSPKSQVLGTNKEQLSERKENAQDFSERISLSLKKNNLFGVPSASEGVRKNPELEQLQKALEQFLGYYPISFWGKRHLPKGMQKIIDILQGRQVFEGNQGNKVTTTVEGILKKLQCLSAEKVNDTYSRWVGLGGPRFAKTQQAYNVMHDILSSENLTFNLDTLKKITEALNKVAKGAQNRIVKDYQKGRNRATLA